MHRFATFLIALSLTCTACGAEGVEPGFDDAEAGGTHERVLEGSRWVDGRGQAMAAPGLHPRAGRVSVVVFFDAEDEGCVRALTALANASIEHPDLDVLGATPRLDQAQLDTLRAQTGAVFPILVGISSRTRDAWQVEDLPAIRAVNEEGKLVARSLMGILARLEDPASR